MQYLAEEKFMRIAIQQAEIARSVGDYAIGAVVIIDGKVVAEGANRIKVDNDPTQHAEIVAIRAACRTRRTRHIEGAILYTTAEPCPMCTGAAIWARMTGIVSGSTIEDMAEFRKRFGNPSFTWRTVDIDAHHILSHGEPKLFLIEGFLRSECQRLFHHS
jgi:tRNA(Arg) A34 adenosine deaminase TadA